MNSIQKEIEQKENKKSQVESSLNSFNSENFLSYFQIEIEHDTDRLNRFENLYAAVKEESIEE